MQDLMCYCVTFGKLHTLNSLSLIAKFTNNLEVILSVGNTKVTLSHVSKDVYHYLWLRNRGQCKICATFGNLRYNKNAAND